MRPSRFLRSTPFRLALTFTFLFVLSFFLSGLVVYEILKGDLSERLDEMAKDTHAIVAATYADSDAEDLIATVESHARNSGKDQLISLTDTAGMLLAGNFAAGALPVGLATIAEGTPGIPAGAAYRAYTGPVGGNSLTVALSYDETWEIETIVLMGFMWAGLIVTILAVAGGAMLASRVQRRLDGIASTLDEVSHGSLGARIPLIGNADDIDAVSSQVNGALDRLAGLVEGMKQVSANIAHDLKTPLNRLQMTLDSAAEKHLSGKDVSEDLVEARAESVQINATFEALLRIAQIEAGARKAKFTSVDLQLIAGRIAEAYGDVAADAGKTLALEAADGGAATISGDAELLLQLLSNLVENAINHCPAGTRIVISVGATPVQVSLVVADTGAGIPDGERGNVLQRLYRLEKSRTTAGSGLGLSLVKAIADLHGAALHLEDNRPGLRVIVTFPAAGP